MQDKRGQSRAIAVCGIQLRSISQLCRLLDVRQQSESYLCSKYGSLDRMAIKLLQVETAEQAAAKLQERLQGERLGLPVQRLDLTETERLLLKALMLAGLKDFDLVYFNNLFGCCIRPADVERLINLACKAI